MAGNSPTVLESFNREDEPCNIGIHAYCVRLRDYMNCSTSAWVLAIIYVDRLTTKLGKQVTIGTVHRIFLSGYTAISYPLLHASTTKNSRQMLVNSTTPCTHHPTLPYPTLPPDKHTTALSYTEEYTPTHAHAPTNTHTHTYRPNTLVCTLFTYPLVVSCVFAVWWSPASTGTMIPTPTITTLKLGGSPTQR